MIIGRKQATAAGEIRYLAKKPCKRGHTSPRLVKCGQCLACANEVYRLSRKDTGARRAWRMRNKTKLAAERRAWYEKNRARVLADKAEEYRAAPELHRERSRRWRAANLDQARLRVTEWQKKNADRIMQYRAASYAADPERHRAASLAWAKKNPDKARALVARRNARKRAATPAWADHSAINAVYLEATRLQAITGVPHDVDHIVPLRGRNVSGLHVHYNLQPLPMSANRRKSNKYEHA